MNTNTNQMNSKRLLRAEQISANPHNLRFHKIAKPFARSAFNSSGVVLDGRRFSLSLGERAGVRGKGRCDGLARPSLHRESASDLWCFSPTSNHTPVKPSLGLHGSWSNNILGRLA